MHNRLAATYDGSRRFLSSRDFRKVNVIKACNQIMNPQLPFALRLSSTLLVGVVRVYCEQTRIILVEATDMMKAVKVLSTRKSADGLQMSPTELREEAITLPLLIDYDMEFPECQEKIISDHVLAFARSDRYFRLPVSPLLTLPSPVSTPEQKKSSGGSTQESRSPFQAEAKDITIQEIDYTKLSPEIIEVPGEIDINGEPLMSDHDMYEGGTEPRPAIIPDMSLEPRAKRQAVEKEGERSPIGLSPPSVELPEEVADVVLFDQETGTFQATSDVIPVPSTSTIYPHEIQPQFATPEVPIQDLEPVAPVTPRKRKLAIDYNIKLSGNEMRNNFKMVNRLSKRKMIDFPQQLSAKELFGLPTSQGIKAPQLLNQWKENAYTTKMELSELPWTVEVPLDTETSPVARRSLELPSRSPPTAVDTIETGDEGLSGIELLRGPTDEASSLFEQSAGMEFTPDQPSAVSRRLSRDQSLSGEKKKEDIGLISAELGRRASSLGRMIPLSPIADVDFELLEDIEERATLLSELAEEIDIEKPDRAALETLSAIRRVMGEDSYISLDDVLPVTTSRKLAAKVFYHIMALARSGILVLDQKQPFAEITIGQGRAY